MPGRPTVVVAATACAVLAGALLLRREPGEAANVPAAPSAPAVVVEDGVALRPPEFPAVAGDEERIVHWVATLQTGADDDVAWAVSRLRLAGGEGRRAVRDAAQVALDANNALVEQALDFLAETPEDADCPFALAALKCHDPQAVVRAVRLLAGHPGADRHRTAREVAAAGLAGARNVRLEALSALTKIGGDVAADAALRLIQASPAADAAAGWGAIAGFKDEKVHAALTAAFATESSVAIRFAVADALVTAGDPAPVAWLESLVASPPPGPLDYGDAAVGALAKARNTAALARIGATLCDPLAGTAARVMAVRRLESYPLDARRAFLESAARGGDDEVRIEALDALVRAGAPDVLDTTLAKLAVEGDDASATVAALVCGRVRRPEAAAALTRAVARADLSDDTRALCLRALVLSGGPGSVDTVVRAIAGDHGPDDAPASLAHNACAMLGDARPEFRAAMGPELLRALSGAFGSLSGAGLVETVRAVGLCCGPEAAAALAARLGDADAAVRANAALALGYAAGPDSERDLRAAWWRAGDSAARAVLATAMERAHFRALPPVR